jgi:hypothetical protein
LKHLCKRCVVNALLLRLALRRDTFALQQFQPLRRKGAREPRVARCGFWSGAADALDFCGEPARRSGVSGRVSVSQRAFKLLGIGH